MLRMNGAPEIVLVHEACALRLDIYLLVGNFGSLDYLRSVVQSTIARIALWPTKLKSPLLLRSN